jgi:hypothetical protein
MAQISRICFVIERRIPRVLRCVLSEGKTNSTRRTVQLLQLRLLRRRRLAAYRCRASGAGRLIASGVYSHSR